MKYSRWGKCKTWSCVPPRLDVGAVCWESGPDNGAEWPLISTVYPTLPWASLLSRHSREAAAQLTRVKETLEAALVT